MEVPNWLIIVFILMCFIGSAWIIFQQEIVGELEEQESPDTRSGGKAMNSNIDETGHSETTVPDGKKILSLDGTSYLVYENMSIEELVLIRNKWLEEAEGGEK